MSATATRVRWECPNGLHPGQLGPRQPRRDNLVRYCIPCSTKAGRLVERQAPALTRQREAAAETAKQKAAAKRAAAAKARQRAAARETERFTVEGVDLRDEFARLCRLRAFGGRSGRLVTRPPRFTVRRMQRSNRYGWAKRWTNEIRLNITPEMDLALARETIVHELSHIVTPDSEPIHGDRFWRTMDAAWKEAYGAMPIKFRVNRYVGRHAAAMRAATGTAR